MKTKPRSHIQVVKDGNDEVIRGDDVCQIDELVDLYQVTLYTKLKKNPNLCVIKNTYVDINVDELNVIY